MALKTEWIMIRKRINYLIILTALLATSSCLNRQFEKGKAVLISTSDTVLNDSAIFTGRVYTVDPELKYPYKEVPFEVWIENSELITTTDSAGYYTIKTRPGTYTIKCQSKWNTYKELIEEMRDIKITGNKKVQLDFYIGTTIE